MAAICILLATGTSFAADVYLKTQSFNETLPDGAVVPMWGFVKCDDAGFSVNCSGPSAPGPRIDLPVGAHTIHLTNTLPVPVSLVIPGQAGGGDPVKPGGRVQSFTKEAAANGGTADYAYSLKAGTYLYQSGTLPAIQVPMGLYGALIVGGDPADQVALFSEIDPAQNVCAHKAAFGLPADAVNDPARCRLPDYPSTVEYVPKYFLVNGKPFSKAAPSDPAYTFSVPWTAPNPLAPVLFRFLNAGLQSHAPTFVNLQMTLIAEDGNIYPGAAKSQSSVLLAAGKTLDVLVSAPAENATYPLFDRMLALTSNDQPDSGMLAYLIVGSGSTPIGGVPSGAADFSFAVTEDTPFNGSVGGQAGLTNYRNTSSPTNGKVAFNVDGTFTYTPNQDFSGTDTFTYVATSGGQDTRVATVALNVSFVNDAPTGTEDAYVNSISADLQIAAPGVLANDVDVDGDALTAVIATPPAAGALVLNADGSFSFSGPPGNYTFTYQVKDAANALSTPVAVNLTLHPLRNLVVTVQGPTMAVSNYRWLIEHDTTYHVSPDNPPPAATDQLGLNFHKSYMPVVTQGHCAGCGSIQVALDPTQHYYMSVLPDDAANPDGHSLGGAPIAPGQNIVNIAVAQQPIPPAQISVLVFNDNSPTNGAPDGNELGLGGFQITLIDAGGRYGIAGGVMSQDAFGNPLKNALLGTASCPGSAPEGVIVTCPNGTALIQNLAPGKYTLTAVAPAGTTKTWSQTSTIEGTRGIDAWVKAGEPSFFQEFGPPGYHVFIGFVSPDDMPVLSGNNSLTGRVTNLHMSRPPDQTLWDSQSRDALAHTTAWAALNSANGLGPAIATVKADDQGYFAFSGIPDGNYQLVIWDEYLDQIIAFRAVTLAGGTATALGNVPVFNWFARTETWIYRDDNRNGIWDAGEPPIPDLAVNLRFRDGTLYQASTTDWSGYYSFDETFPFFNWLVAEVDYSRFMATGVTVHVDAGGNVAGGPFPGVLNPQVQADASLQRTELSLNNGAYSPVLLEAFQGFLGQTNVLQWGKSPYQPGENGGIVGIVYYASTRAEFDPRLGVGDPWEPGIPGVKVRLWREIETNQLDANGNRVKVLNLVRETQTDSWDASPPSGCPGETDALFINTTLGGDATRCYDGMRNWNQVRPGVFDGGYAFLGIPPGKYVVEVVPPPGYEIVKEEDVNVGFGETFSQSIAPATVAFANFAIAAITPDQAIVQQALSPEPGLLQPPCVGDPHVVPLSLSLFPGDAPFAGATTPLCNKKQVVLTDQAQANADFFLFTSTPIAGHFAGMILNDLAQEFNPASPQFGEKWAPPFVPISVRDFNGHEVSRVYSDQWGRFNGLLPSTFNANLPQPSGYSPAMLMTCMNDPGPIPGPNNTLITDPHYNPMFSNFCYTFQYMPGTTTYLDTPVLPTAAFASGDNPVDCAAPDQSPVIRQVDGDGVGPFVNVNGPLRLTIYSMGAAVSVPNPAYSGPGSPEPKMIARDFSFGTSGSVTLNGVPLTIESWTPDRIVAVIPRTTGGAPVVRGQGQLVVNRNLGGSTASSVYAATVSIEGVAPIRVSAGQSIQAAIDNARPGQLILVGPGTYNELVIMWKPVRLQGAGAGSTFINAAKFPTEKLVAWRQKVEGLIASGAVDLLPNQPAGNATLAGPGVLGFEEGAGITVLGKNLASCSPGNTLQPGFICNFSRIDGFSITGGDIGGGIFVNGWAHGLEISNNDIFTNSGQYHGGLRVGHPFLELAGNGPFGYNKNLKIHNNAVRLNGGLNGAGGGISLCTGTDFYRVTNNFVCGNFTAGDGGGIGHFGLSNLGTIANNTIRFNQSFNQGLTKSGGGIFIGGEPVALGLTRGSGHVVVDANLIQGNHAGAGHGGGIRTQQVNGLDVQTPDPWFVRMTNNIIINNVAGWSGAGVSLQDTTRATIVNNTIAHNDSTSTVGATFTAGPNTSAPQPAGISSERHSPLLAPLVTTRFSNPTLNNNVIWKNRSFYYDAATGVAQLVPVLSQTTVGQCPAGANYWDLGVLGEAQTNPTLRLTPAYSVLTSTVGYSASLNNTSADPLFRSAYCNGPRTLRLLPGEVTTLLPLPALDEGGNFIDVRWGPLTPMQWDYHLNSTSPAINTGLASPANDHDFDMQPRPQGGAVDRGADEVR
ncbi:MAG: SdrD B-like domain-containing protein [Terriglobales bacterium]